MRPAADNESVDDQTMVGGYKSEWLRMEQVEDAKNITTINERGKGGC